MASNIIETNQLTHRFSQREVVLDDISLSVPSGSIYGFLGPNGAGKTTTLKLLLGLLKKQHGSISIYDKSFSKNRVELLKHIGSLIESPSLYGQLTASENLEVMQKIYRCPKSRIPEVLRLVGLADTGRKKANQFSLGMKQRLGIAVALLHNPSLLILDEPTNGLDPNSIIEVRELLKKLNRESGITILLSSHLLAEIEKLATHVGIIHKGKILFQGTLDELHSKQQNSAFISITTSNQTATLQLIIANKLHAWIENENVVIDLIPKENIAALNRQLVEAGIDVYQINMTKNDLESIFMDLINT